MHRRLEKSRWSEEKRHTSQIEASPGDLHSPSLEGIQRELVAEGRETGPRYAQSTARQEEGTRTKRREGVRSARGPADALVHSGFVCRQRDTFSHRGSVDSHWGPAIEDRPENQAARLLLSRPISPVISTLAQAPRGPRNSEDSRSNLLPSRLIFFSFTLRTYVGRIS